MSQRISAPDSKRSRLPDEHVDRCSRELRLTGRACRSSVQKCQAVLTACSIVSLHHEHSALPSLLQNLRLQDRCHLNEYPLPIPQAVSVPLRCRRNYLLESQQRNIRFPNASSRDLFGPAQCYESDDSDRPRNGATFRESHNDEFYVAGRADKAEHTGKRTREEFDEMRCRIRPRGASRYRRLRAPQECL